MSIKDLGETETEPQGNMISRRDFALVTALGAAAATSFFAQGECLPDAPPGAPAVPLTFDQVTTPGNSCYIGEPCATFLKKLYAVEQHTKVKTTINTLVYGSLYSLVESLQVREPKTSSLYALLGGVMKTVKAIDDESTASPITLADMFAYDEYSNPRSTNNKVTMKMWSDVYQAWRYNDGTSTLNHFFPLLFLDLPPLGPPTAPSGQRHYIKSLLLPKGTADTPFKLYTSQFNFIDLYIMSAKEACVDGNGNFSFEGYTLVREAFDLGMLSIKRSVARRNAEYQRDRANTPGGGAVILAKNGRCWSVSQQMCVESTESADYCATSNGQPTASSDFC